MGQNRRTFPTQDSRWNEKDGRIFQQVRPFGQMISERQFAKAYEAS
jgi:hypothetical protein